MGILTLSGWTQPTDALQPLIPDSRVFDYSEYATPEAAIEALAQFRDIDHIVAWSMGSWLTLRAIEAGALTPQTLLLIATPYQFVNDEHFKDGMPQDTYSMFRENYAKDPKRTSGRFHGLVAKGDAHMRRVMEELSHHPHVVDTGRWLPWLDAMAEDPLHNIKVKTPQIELIHGAKDAIVPYAQGEHLAKHLPQLVRHRWEEAGHAPHIHDKARFQETVRRLHGG